MSKSMDQVADGIIREAFTAFGALARTKPSDRFICVCGAVHFYDFRKHEDGKGCRACGGMTVNVVAK